MLVKTWLNVTFDEFFFYEYQKCQLRASYIANSNYTRRQYCEIKNKIISVKAAMYVPYNDTFVYLINKKILFLAINSMIEDSEIDSSWFKKSVLLILEKEIKANKKKANQNSEYYNKIRKRIVDNSENLFNMINSSDFDYSVKNCFREKISLEGVINNIRDGVGYGVRKSIPEYEYLQGFPFLNIDILSLNYNEGELTLVFSHIFDLSDEMLHRNFFIKILFRYFISKIDNLNFDLAIEADKINKIIIYNPLTFDRKVVYFDEVKSTLSEMDLFRVMNAYIDNNLARTLDSSNCAYCENKKFCYIKTRSNNKKALSTVLNIRKNNDKTEELI